MVALIRSERGIALTELCGRLGISLASVKRIHRQLRRAGILVGRGDNVRINFGELVKPPVSCSTANVAAALDVPAIGSLGPSKTTAEGDAEYELLRQLCYSLPRSARYEGRIIVEKGQIQMGDPESAVLLTVHAMSHDVLFDFVRLGIEKTKGIMHTRTLMIARTVE
jgi:hypothetical protein